MIPQIYHRQLSVILQSFILFLGCLLNWSPSKAQNRTWHTCTDLCAGLCMWQKSSAISHSLCKDQDFQSPETVYLTPQPQPKGNSTMTVPCYYCTGQRWENHISLLGPMCNNYLAENPYNTPSHVFCFSLPVLAKALRSKFSFHPTILLNVLWDPLLFLSLEVLSPSKSKSYYFSKYATHSAERQYKEPKHISHHSFQLLSSSWYHMLPLPSHNHLRLITEHFHLCTLSFSHSLHN